MFNIPEFKIQHSLLTILSKENGNKKSGQAIFAFNKIKLY